MKREWQSEREARQRPTIALYRPPHKRADSNSPPHWRRTDSGGNGGSQPTQSDMENRSCQQIRGIVHGNPSGQSDNMTNQEVITVSCCQGSPQKSACNEACQGEDKGSTEGCQDGTRGNSHRGRGCNPRTAALYYPPHKRKILAENGDTPYLRRTEKNGVLLHRGEFRLEVEVRPNQWWRGVIKVSHHGSCWIITSLLYSVEGGRGGAGRDSGQPTWVDTTPQECFGGHD